MIKILLLTSKNESDERIDQRKKQIEQNNPGTTVTVYRTQSEENSESIQDAIKQIDSDNYSSVVFDSGLVIHPWHIINDYRNGHPDQTQLKFVIDGDVSMLTRSFLESARLMGNVLIIKDNETLIDVCRGNIDGKENGSADEIQTDTQHNICSIGKMLTGLTVLKLAENDPDLLNNFVIKYLPDSFPQRDEYRWVTVRNLLTHTSGMGDYAGKYHEVLDDPLQPHPKFESLNDMVPFVEEVSLEGQGKTERDMRYSNLGFAVLGEVIERTINADQPEGAAHKSYWDAVDEYILTPSGAKIIRDVPSTDKTSATNAEHPTTLHIASSPAGGNMWASTEDLAKFSQWVTAQCHDDPDFQPMLESIKLEGAPAPDGSKYAFGIVQRPVAGQMAYCHNGAAPGISSDLTIYPKDKSAIVVFLNSSFYGMQARQLGQRLEDTVLKAHNIHYIPTDTAIPSEYLRSTSTLEISQQQELKIAMIELRQGQPDPADIIETEQTNIEDHGSTTPS